MLTVLVCARREAGAKSFILLHIAIKTFSFFDVNSVICNFSWVGQDTGWIQIDAYWYLILLHSSMEFHHNYTRVVELRFWNFQLVMNFYVGLDNILDDELIHILKRRTDWQYLRTVYTLLCAHVRDTATNNNYKSIFNKLIIIQKL